MQSVNSQGRVAPPPEGSTGEAYHDASPLDVGLCCLRGTQPARKRALEALQL